MAKGKIIKLSKSAKRVAALIIDKHARGKFIQLMLDAEDTKNHAYQPRRNQGQ